MRARGKDIDDAEKLDVKLLVDLKERMVARRVARRVAMLDMFSGVDPDVENDCLSESPGRMVDAAVEYDEDESVVGDEVVEFMFGSRRLDSCRNR